MGASQSYHRGQPFRPLQSHNQKHNPTITPAELQSPTPKMSKDQRELPGYYLLIMDFAVCCLEYLEIPDPTTEILEAKYTRYVRYAKHQAIKDKLGEDALLNPDIWNALVTWDFARVRQISKNRGHFYGLSQMLDAIEESIKRRTAIPNFPSFIFVSRYSETSRRMLGFFRYLHNDDSNIMSTNERFLLNGIAKFLELYSRPDYNYSKDSFLRNLKTHIADVYRSRQMDILGTSSTESYEHIPENELSNLKEKLIAMGAQNCDLKFATLVGAFLLREEISQKDWAWLEENISYHSVELSQYKFDRDETKLSGNQNDESPPPYKATGKLTSL